MGINIISLYSMDGINVYIIYNMKEKKICVCKHAVLVTKVSENGISTYCIKCGKSYNKYKTKKL
jgi:hypothetical protein